MPRAIKNMDCRYFYQVRIVTDKKGLEQLACPKEWKKYEEGNE
jgi:hypothetical protein